MAFDDRLEWLLLGVLLGYFMGYVTRSLREIKEGVDKVEAFLRNKPRPAKKKADDGGVNRERFNQIMLLLVVVLTAFAAFRSQYAANQAEHANSITHDNQAQLKRVVGCVIKNQTAYLNVVNERTEFTKDQALANKDLQKAQRVFFGVLLHIPPYPPTRRVDAAQDYQNALDHYLNTAKAYEKNTQTAQYPTANDLLKCVDSKTKGKAP